MPASSSWGSLAALDCRRPLAQDAEPDVRVSAVVLPTTGEIYRGDITAVTTGLRRGLRNVSGIDFVYAEELLSRRAVPEEVYAAQDSISEIDARLTTESPSVLLEEIGEIWETFEGNLAAVSRSTLVRVLTMRGVAECRLQPRDCGESFRQLLAFRESRTLRFRTLSPRVSRRL